MHIRYNRSHQGADRHIMNGAVKAEDPTPATMVGRVQIEVAWKPRFQAKRHFPSCTSFYAEVCDVSTLRRYIFPAYTSSED